MRLIQIAVLVCCMGWTGGALAQAAAPAKKTAPARARVTPAVTPVPAAVPAVTPQTPPAVVPPGSPPAEVPPGNAAEVEQNTALPPPSSAAQQVYSAAKGDLLQIRMLLRNGRTQSSVGSGFLVGTSNLVLTNYHVVSQMAIEPNVYVGEFVDTDGKSGPVELMAVDVLHDLAVVRVNRSGTGFFNIPDTLPKLTQGQYLYSLGNPLDLGFAISEGSYNGVVSRSFYDQLMFSGPINSGMSGGPSVTIDGAVAGVNVSKRRDGESVSFLVPIRYAQDLLAEVEKQNSPPRDFNAVIGEQLLAHQRAMVNRLLDTPLDLKSMGPYVVPVRESDQVRCWGRSNVKGEATFTADIMACAMQSAIFVSESQQTGYLSMTHQYVRSASLDPLRFSVLASKQFNASLGNSRDARLTAPMCTEKFVKTRTLPLRAVTCVRAYRKFAGLYNFTLLTASTDDSRASLQSRLDVSGVSFENGVRTTRAFLEALGRGGRK